MMFKQFVVSVFFSAISFASIADEYLEKIQPIFDNRCIACHSCLNGPCQLNLQNYEGFARGAHHQNVYDGTRLNSVHPTRPGIDGKSVLDWRNLGFHELNTSKKLEENLFYQFIGDKALEKKDIPFKTVKESAFCLDDLDRTKILFSLNDSLKMPYALPPITAADKKTLGLWLEKGAPGPTRLNPFIDKKQVLKWENFFNHKDERHKLVSRYLYEHLFLAHIYFTNNQKTYYRLVRSRTQCQSGIDEINTRRPNDPPGGKSFYYCLKPYLATIVAKTHLPFEFNDEVLKRLNHLFFKTPWKITTHKTYEEKYQQVHAENPFHVFSDIPVKARYQFLLDNAHFIVSTFIKGPVCNGSMAVNSIQEQFYVMFIDPNSDNMVRSKEFENKAKDLLILPGHWGSDIKLTETLALNKTIIKHREGYRNLRADWMVKLFPEGYDLNDLWDGEGFNENALLTVFRHDDNAKVTKGFKGDLPKTFFFLDYALLERLVYNLVVNFDVYGNISHQMLTRIYMDLIRMEAEEIFLSFLPPESRTTLRQDWYRGFLSQAMIDYIYPLAAKDHPTKIKYQNPKHAKLEFVKKVLSERIHPNVRGNHDAINWKLLGDLTLNESINEEEKLLRDLASIEAQNGFKFVNHLPETSYLLVQHPKKESTVYTFIKNREHDNISWILGESLRFNEKEDRLTVLPGFYSYYPNQFFVVQAHDLKNFRKMALKVDSKSDYQKFLNQYGVSRVSPQFWSVFDELNLMYKKYHIQEAGVLDLTRYEMH